MHTYKRLFVCLRSSRKETKIENEPFAAYKISFSQPRWVIVVNLISSFALHNICFYISFITPHHVYIYGIIIWLYRPFIVFRLVYTAAMNGIFRFIFCICIHAVVNNCPNMISNPHCIFGKLNSAIEKNTMEQTHNSSLTGKSFILELNNVRKNTMHHFL